MMPLHWLFRMRRWVTHPPPWHRVLLVLGVVAACLLLVGLEWVFGWPDWLTLSRTGRPFR